MSVRLRAITKDTVREICALQVKDEQEGYVASNALSMAQAHFEPTVVFRGVYAGERPVGFIQWRAGPTPGTTILWRFMIDRAHQALGYGRGALALAFADMRAAGFEAVETSVVLGPASPLAFYLSQGFVETGRTTPHGEWWLRRPLP